MTVGWGREKVRCEECDCLVALKGMKHHLESNKHRRSIGELPKLPPRPAKGGPRGRPKKDGPLFMERNPRYYSETYRRCDVCDIDVIRGAMSAHRGTRAHMKAVLSAAKREWEAETAVTCMPCAAPEAPEGV